MPATNIYKFFMVVSSEIPLNHTLLIYCFSNRSHLVYTLTFSHPIFTTTCHRLHGEHPLAAAAETSFVCALFIFFLKQQ